MEQAPDAYKMSHKTRAVYSLWQSSRIPSLQAGKNQDLEPSNNQCSGKGKLIALPAVILVAEKFLISKPGQTGPFSYRKQHV